MPIRIGKTIIPVNATLSAENTSNINILQYPSLEIAEKFIEMLTGEKDSRNTFACYHDKEKRSKEKPAKTFYGTISEHFNELCRLNEQGYGIFVTVQETFSEKRKTEDIGKTRSFFVDIDKPGILPKFHIKPSIIVESSPSKYQIHWLLKEHIKQSPDEFKSIISPLIKHYNADEECKDLSRVLRIPGFNHCKGEFTPVKLLDISNVKYSIDEIRIWQSEKHEPYKKIENNDNTYIEKLLIICEKTIDQIKKLERGKRHNTLNKKCYHLGGLLSQYPNLWEDYRLKIHETIYELENNGKWDKLEATHTTIDDGFEKGKQSPIQLDLSEKPSKQSILKKKVLEWLDTVGELRWNEMGLKLELNGNEVDTTELHQTFMDDMNFDCVKESFKDLIIFLSKQKSYHPVIEYLDSLDITKDIDDEYVSSIFDLLYQALNLNDKPPIQKVMVKKWLIGCVARIYDPGCKFDNVLILKSPKQGVGKTSFFEVLFGDFFQTVGSHKTEADEILNLQQAWVSEYGEIEVTFDKKGISALKAFLTKRADTFRAPYDPAPKTIQRRFAFCGTTNEEQFLSDATGNRRYWVIDVLGKVILELISDIRDEIFRCVKYLYFQGINGSKNNGKPKYADFLWWMNESDEELVAENVTESEQTDSLEDIVMGYLMASEYISMQNIIQRLKHDEIDLPQNRGTEMRIANIFKRAKIGKAKQLTINNVRSRYYRWDSHWDAKLKEKAEERERIKLAKEAGQEIPEEPKSPYEF